MPPPYDRIRPIDRVYEASDLTMVINERIEELNRVLAEIALNESRTRGDDGFTPTFNANVNMTRKRITNASRSEHGLDVVIRQELIDLGLYSESGEIEFNKPVYFANEVRSRTNPGGGNSLITEETVRQIVAELLDEALAVAFDGDFLTTRYIGFNGVTPGNPMMGRDEQGRAVFVKADNEQMAVHDVGTRDLLGLVLKELQTITQELQRINEHGNNRWSD